MKTITPKSKWENDKVLITLDQASKMLEANVEYLRNEAGAFAQHGKEDAACGSDQGATLLEGALALIELARKRI